MPAFRYLTFLLLNVALLPACNKATPLTTQARPQTGFDPRLRRELDSIDVEDQKYRILLMEAMGSDDSPGLDSLKKAAGIADAQVGPYLAEQMVKIDSANIKRVGEMIRQGGYPGKTRVGEPTNEVALLVIQHSTRIPRYLGLIEQEAAKGEVPYYLYARMLDRHLMQQGKPQRYGTQGRSYHVRNAQGQPETISLIWPIEDAAHVNERRKKAGFDSTVEANAERLRIPYRPVTMAEVQEIERRAAAAAHP
ncbi:hypothetical protein LJY25_12475 [Hymenobacter sp. BT175]|uniref:DUF6624 domain-containing protein n=1 Tax=Hymenobacter translucens TaxID=2886507 RepID=UPI001D0E68EC|nr:DUF6624 domain-containing protein [Hymenobacter translucens]MCC2547263.1 hypothetical protein [Hymenobacter translucens]